MNEDRLNVPSYLERFFRAFDVKGPLPDSFEPDVQLGVTLADLTRFEYGWLKRETAYMGGADVTGVAAQFSGIELGNPTGGNKLAFDVFVHVVNTTAAAIPISLLVGNFVLNINTDISARIQIRDTRQRQGTALAPPSSCQLYVGNDPVGMGVTAMNFEAPASSEMILGPFVLKPDTGVTLERNTVNTLLSAWIEWKERDLESTEF